MKPLRAFWLATALVAASLPNLQSRGADTIKDSESAAHGDDSAWYQVVDTYEFPGAKMIQFNLGVLSHYSYLLVSGKEAWVVDPGRDVNAYLD